MSRQQTHEDYLQKLKDKNIEIYPLEPYINNTTKIKHQCICGNTWDVTPKKVKIGQQCGCGVYKTHEQYLQELKDKNINIVPVEKYKTIQEKIKHKCYCGNIWNTMPESVLRNHGCGCKSGGYDVNFYRGKPTILYYVLIDGLYKIGVRLYREYKSIDDNIIKRRYSDDIRAGRKVEILKAKLYDDGAEAYLREQLILEEFSHLRYKTKPILISGNTELFSENILSETML